MTSMAKGSVSALRIDIRTLKSNDRTIRIYLPPDYGATEKRYPVLYMHDGEKLFEEDHAGLPKWRVNASLDSLFEKNETAGVIVAGVDSSANRWDEYSPWKNSDKIRGGSGDAYAEFIVYKLKPLIDATYRTLPDRENAGVAGSSMGGFISLYIALKYPHLFSKAGVFSPAFWFARDKMLDFIKATSLKQGLRVYMDAGTDEGRLKKEYLEDAKVFSKLLSKDNKIDQRFFIDEGGAHSETAWAKRFPRAFTWLYGNSAGSPQN